MSKFFFKPSALSDDMVTITGNMAHHILHVLRLRIGQELILCDGKCTDFKAKLLAVTEKPTALTFALLSHTYSDSETIVPITLFQGLPKGDKMDWIIEKCVESGVNKIIPVCTARTVAKVKDSDKKTERFMRISESAAAQSMRGIVPAVSQTRYFSEVLAAYDSNYLHLVAFEKERCHTIKSVINCMQPKPIAIWIGPEGGFEDNEVCALEAKGAIPVSLGPRILRSETAGLVALAQVLCLWEH